MRDIPEPWPSQPDLEKLVAKSEGLFIWASTLVKFVEGSSLPHITLQSALNIHTGLDPLYHRVLLAAPRYGPFELVLSTIILIQKHLSAEQLGLLLGLGTDVINAALAGLGSILIIPEKNDRPIQPFHASLHNFLTDSHRSQEFFINPAIYHTSILLNCLKIILTNHKQETDPNEVIRYACVSWCHHLHSAVFHGASDYLLLSESKDLLDATGKLASDMFES